MKEAPLAAMTTLTRLAVGARRKGDGMVAGGLLNDRLVRDSLAKWQAKVRALAKEVRHLEALHTQGFEQHEDLKGTKAVGDATAHTSSRDLVALVNLDNGKVHVQSELPLRTRCGWAASAPQVHVAPAAEHAFGNRCGRCWRRVIHDGLECSSASESA